MINQAEQTLSDRLPREISEIWRELRALKTRQMNGGDNLVYDWSGVAGAGFNVPYGDAITVQSMLTSLVPGVPLFPLPLIAVYISATSPDPTKLWPNGSGLTADEKRYVQVSTILDLYHTSGDAMSWVCTTQVFNTGSVGGNFYYQSRWRFPRLAT